MEQDWQNKIFRVEERTAKVLEKEFLADISFAVCKKDEEKDPTILKAHKLMLASASSVFEVMFYGSMAHKSDKPIPIDDVDSKTFSRMLKYIYSNKIDIIAWDDLAKLYGAAHKYLLDALSDYCIGELQKMLNATNALKTYNFAKFYENNLLLKAAFEFIKKETSAVIQSPDFLKIDESTLLTILAEKELGATEMELYKALEAVALAQKAKANNPACFKFREAVKKINFLAMTAEEFSDGPATSNLLLPEESLSILRCLVNPMKSMPLYPKGFAQERIRKNHSLCLHLEIRNTGMKLIINFKSNADPTTATKLLISCGNFQFLQITSQRNTFVMTPMQEYTNTTTKAYKIVGDIEFTGPGVRDYKSLNYKENLCILHIGNDLILGQLIEGSPELFFAYGDILINFKIGTKQCTTMSYTLYQ